MTENFIFEHENALTAMSDDDAEGFDVPVAKTSASPIDQAPAIQNAPTPDGDAAPVPAVPILPDGYAQPILARLRKEVAPLVKTFLAKRNEYEKFLREIEDKGLTRGSAERKRKEIESQMHGQSSADDTLTKVDEVTRLKNIPHEAFRHARTLLFKKFDELKAPHDGLFDAVEAQLEKYEAEAVAAETKLFNKFNMKREETGVARRINHVRKAARDQRAALATISERIQTFRTLLPRYELTGFNQLFGDGPC